MDPHELRPPVRKTGPRIEFPKGRLNFPCSECSQNRTETLDNRAGILEAETKLTGFVRQSELSVNGSWPSERFTECPTETVIVL